MYLSQHGPGGSAIPGVRVHDRQVKADPRSVVDAVAISSSTAQTGGEFGIAAVPSLGLSARVVLLAKGDAENARGRWRVRKNLAGLLPESYSFFCCEGACVETLTTIPYRPPPGISRDGMTDHFIARQRAPRGNSVRGMTYQLVGLRAKITGVRFVIPRPGDHFGMKLWRDTTRGSRRTWTLLGIGMFILALLWAGLAVPSTAAFRRARMVPRGHRCGVATVRRRLPRACARRRR